jgi:hypothetical protein
VEVIINRSNSIADFIQLLHYCGTGHNDEQARSENVPRGVLRDSASGPFVDDVG